MILEIVWVGGLAGLIFVSPVASFLRLLLRRLTPLGALKVFQARPGQRAA